MLIVPPFLSYISTEAQRFTEFTRETLQQSEKMRACGEKLGMFFGSCFDFFFSYMSADVEVLSEW